MEPFSLPSPRARTLFHLQALARLALFWAPVTAVGMAVGSAAWSVQGALTAGAGFLFFQAVLALWWPHLSWQALGWHLGEHELLVRRGVLVRTVTAIPRSRVQHVDLRQGPLEQAFGLVRLEVHTASGLGADGLIPGLEPEEAQRLRHALTGAAPADDGV
jgi:hypothetical protein